MSTTRRLQKLFSWVHRDDNPNDQAHSIDKALPTFDELPSFQNFKGCAWEVWGKDDQLGTVNLLTPDVVKRAAAEEILYEIISQIEFRPDKVYVEPERAFH